MIFILSFVIILLNFIQVIVLIKFFNIVTFMNLLKIIKLFGRKLNILMEWGI